MKKVRYKLHEVMDSKGLTIYKVAKETKIDKAAIKKIYCNVSRQVRFDTLEILMDFFDCELLDLIEVTNIEE